jgi:ABC-2 type transport system ATP-binding protein
MNQVEALCDRVALINRGELMVYGAVDEVRRRYSHPAVRIHARGTLPAVPIAATTLQEGDGSWRVTLGNGAEPPDLLRALVAAGACIDRFDQVLAPMEDIFLRVVREGRA